MLARAESYRRLLKGFPRKEVAEMSEMLTAARYWLVKLDTAITIAKIVVDAGKKVITLL